MENARPQIISEQDVWILRIEKDNGRVQEYRCATEAQARQLAMVLIPSPEKK